MFFALSRCSERDLTLTLKLALDLAQQGFLVAILLRRSLRLHRQEHVCPASSPLADWRQSSWPVRGTDRPPVVAGDNRGAMTLEATRKLSHLSVRAIASTNFL